MARAPLLPPRYAALLPPSSPCAALFLRPSVRLRRSPARSSSSVSATRLSKSLSPHAAHRGTQVPPFAKPCSAPVAPCRFFRTALPLRSNQSQCLPAHGPLRLFWFPLPAPRAPQNFLSSNPPVWPTQFRPANISASRSELFCWRCNPPQSKSVRLQSAQCPGQSFPLREYQTA